MIRLEIPNYPIEVVLSEKQRKKFYRKQDDKKLPVSILNRIGGIYEFDKDGFVVDSATKERILANPSKVGTPKTSSIAGNDSYSGWHPHLRMKVVATIKDYFRKYVKTLEPLTHLPVHIEMELHCPPRDCSWDLDNMWLYNKCFQDVLRDEGIVPDDNILSITKSAAPEYFPCCGEEERKIVFKITPDTRQVIAEHIMFNLKPKTFIFVQEMPPSIPYLEVVAVKDLIKLGFVQVDNSFVQFNIGRNNISTPALMRACGKLFNIAINQNKSFLIRRFLTNASEWYKFKGIVERNLCKKGIDVYIIE